MPSPSSGPSCARVVARAKPEPRWRPGLAVQPFHSEIFAPATEASGAGLALALARDALLPEGPQEPHRGAAQGRDREAVTRASRRPPTRDRSTYEFDQKRNANSR